MSSDQKIFVGMSGGVDSSVAAALLKEQGYQVVGLFMKNWEETDENGVCSSAADYQDVVRVCEKLDIPYYSVNFVKEYWEGVFRHFLAEYEAGFTPNPDILCNREIKFKVFLQKAIEMGADSLATGHYCQNLETPSGRRALVKGSDPGKDQTYFVYTLQQAALRQVLFPVGALLKKQVRAIAAKYDLSTQAKKDSTGICFIGERDFAKFLSQYVSIRPGDLCTLQGERVGEHQGVAYYTIGQRKGLGIGGSGEAWFVVGKDIARNIVYVERGGQHPALFADELVATEPSWVSGAAPEFPFRCQAKIRYRQPDQPCVVTKLEDGRLRVEFDKPQRAITPRQSVVFYAGDAPLAVPFECLGGAMIEAAGPTYHERGIPLPAL